MPLFFITLLIVGVTICYFTGKVVMDTMVETDKFPWIFKGLTVFLGGLLLVGFGFLILMLVAGYDEFVKIFK